MKMRRTRSTATRGNPPLQCGDIDTFVEATSMPQQPQISVAKVLRLEARRREALLARLESAAELQQHFTFSLGAAHGKNCTRH